MARNIDVLVKSIDYWFSCTRFPTLPSTESTGSIERQDENEILNNWLTLMKEFTGKEIGNLHPSVIFSSLPCYSTSITRIHELYSMATFSTILASTGDTLIELCEAYNEATTKETLILLNNHFHQAIGVLVSTLQTLEKFIVRWHMDYHEQASRLLSQVCVIAPTDFPNTCLSVSSRRY